MPIKNHKYGIYAITCNKNNKKYVGQSSRVTIRWRQHKCDLKANRHCNLKMQEDFNKYGIEYFYYEILEFCKNDIADDRERYWINFYNTNNPSNGYNKESGGKSKYTLPPEITKNMGVKIGNKVSEETRKKLSEVNKGHIVTQETRLKISKANKGHKMQEHVKLALLKSNIGKKRTDEQIKKLIDACKIKNTGIKRSLETRRKMSESKKGKPSNRIGEKLSEESKKLISEAKKDKMIKIICVNTGEIYQSINEASRKTGARSGNISLCLQGKRKTVNGLIFKKA